MRLQQSAGLLVLQQGTCPQLLGLSHQHQKVCLLLLLPQQQQKACPLLVLLQEWPCHDPYLEQPHSQQPSQPPACWPLHPCEELAALLLLLLLQFYLLLLLLLLQVYLLLL